MTGLIIFITALVVVIATSLIKTKSLSTKAKSALAIAVSIVGGAVAVVVENGGFDNFVQSGLVGTILMVYGAATAIYKFVVPEDVDEKLEDLFSGHGDVAKHIPGQYNED